MERMKEKILQLLRQSAERPLKMREIAKHLEVGDDSLRDLKIAVKELLESGEIVKTRGKRFGVPEHMNLVVGAFIGHRDGYGFVQPLPRPGQVNLPDIYVSGRNIDTAMHGDKVVARVSGHLTSQRLRGEVIRVLERANQTVLGYYEEGRNFGYVVPIDERITQHVYVDFADSLDAQPGQVVLAEVTEYPSYHRNPEGKILEILGQRGEKGLDTELLIRKHGLPAEFPPSVLKTAEQLPETIPAAEVSRRTDLRDLPLVTIDPVDAKDFDDAVSIEINEHGNYVLGVHIADVSYYIEEGSAIDDEAYDRATSIYLEDRVLPMLPERISNGLCSLRENEDRLAFTVTMEISPRGRLIHYEIFESVIRSRHRMTYDEVFAILQDGAEAKERFSEFADNLRTMNKLARVLRAKRMARGSLDFNFPEARAIFDHEGEVVDIVLQKHTVAHELIEEFMLVANETVARHVTGHEAPMVYRIHEEPDSERMSAFREFIASLGYKLSEKDSKTPRGLQRISLEARGRPEETLINYLMLRSLREARYSPENVGHFGLACECYTHFTSPIRRYPDLVVHRILKTLDQRKKTLSDEDYSDVLKRVAEHCSLRERRSLEAERESLLTKQLMFMQNKVGDVFNGRITGVHSYGLFVELTDFLVEGLVHVSSLDDDYYTFMEEKHSLLGENRGKVYRLGDEISVQVVRVDIEKRRMDFVIADHEGEEDRKHKAKKAQPKRVPEKGARQRSRGKTTVRRTRRGRKR